MKGEKMKTKKKALLGILMLALMCMMLFPTSAFAKTKTVKNQKFVTKLSTINKKAATVKKGTVTLKMKSQEGYIKFKAPKTKTYKFAFSNLKILTPGSDQIVHGHASGYMISPYNGKNVTSMYSRPFSTKGGKNDTLFVTTNYCWGLDPGKEVNENTSLPARTGKIRLKKGETLYFYLYFTSKNCSLKLKIS